MSPPRRNLKRPRLTDSRTGIDDSSAPSPQAIPHTHPEFYFDDGNLIIAADNTHFRVHKSMLSRNSEVFRDMLSLPQPSTKEDLIDGCQVVHVSDSPEDIAVLFSLIYNGCQKYVRFSEPQPFSSIVAMVDLGYKYQMEDIRKEGVSRLQQCFPSELKAFRKLTACEKRDLPVDTTIQDAIEAINLARKYDIQSILPTAFYICAQLPTAEIAAGFPNSTHRGVTRQLSQNDLIRCLRGRDKLVETTTITIASLLPPLKCLLAGDCFHQLLQFQASLGMFGWTLKPDTLFHFPPDVELPDICKLCERSMFKELNAEAERMWTSLAKTFNLS